MIPCHINGIRVGTGAPVRLMGVINLSPESFFRPSYIPGGKVREAALLMQSLGAEIIDLGARATGPGSVPLDVATERERICSALRELEGTGLTVSVDTTRPEVFDASLRYEVHALNDISGLSDPGMGQLLADSGLPAVLMAAGGRPGEHGDIGGILSDLERVIRRCGRWGIEEFVLDPGIGLWSPSRTTDDDWEICRRFNLFRRFDRPLLAAVSRKTFLGAISGREPDERLATSLVVAYHLLQQGASMVRAHDVRETRDMISAFERLRSV